MDDNQDTSQTRFDSSPFDVIRHEEDGREYWLARELAPLLRYNKWQNFEQVLTKAKIACKYNGRDVEQDFTETSKVISQGRGVTRQIRDLQLSRYACYLIVLSADSAKPIIAQAKNYFAVQTRRQEVADAETFAQLSEDEKRLIYRAQLALYNRRLAQTAHTAGVVTTTDHAAFADAGYRGLYGGLTENDIHALKKLAPKEEVSDWMASEELADNIFRAAQTDAALKREQIRGKNQANATHFAVGRKVREFIINELGGTAPEALPTPEKSIQQLEREEKVRLKHQGQLRLFGPDEERSQGE
jgi:DNA-damage-inducible protein D